MHELKDYGTICDLDLDPNLVGLVAPHQVRLCSRGLHPLHRALCQKSNLGEMIYFALGPIFQGSGLIAPSIWLPL